MQILKHKKYSETFTQSGYLYKRLCSPLLESLLINHRSQIQCGVRIEPDKVTPAMEIAPFLKHCNKKREQSLIKWKTGRKKSERKSGNKEINEDGL